MESDVLSEDPNTIVERFMTLLQATLELESSRNEEEAIDLVAHGVALLDYPNVMISLLFSNESSPVIRSISAIGKEWESIKPDTVRPYPGPDILAKVLESGQPRFVPDSRIDPDCNKEAVEKSGIVTQYIVPLITSEMRIGTMQIHMPTCSKKPEMQCKMLDALAGHLSLSISRFRNLRKLQEAEDRIMSFTKFALTNEIASVTMHQIKEEIEDFDKVIVELMKDERVKGNSYVFQKLKTLQRKVADLSERAARPLQFVLTEEDFQKCYVKDLVQETISNWHDTAEIRGCRIRGIFQADDMLIYIRPSHLRELFSCLILNAIQASAKKIEIVVSKGMEYCGECEKEPCAVIRISDDGIGIPLDAIDDIFELGYTTKQKQKQEQGLKKGTGMGMFIAKRMADAMNGDITVESAGKTAGKSRTILKLAIPLEE